MPRADAANPSTKLRTGSSLLAQRGDREIKVEDWNGFLERKLRSYTKTTFSRTRGHLTAHLTKFGLLEAERAGDLSEGRQLAQALAADIAGRLNRSRPVVIGSCNLVVRYQADLAAALLDGSRRGLCVICAGGRVQDGALYAHGIFKFVGAGTVPALELAEES